MAARPAIPRTVVTLGIVSLLMDTSSEMIHAILPLFLTTTLGASVAFVGLVDGIAESTASISKVFSGYVSDRIGRRKPLVLLGYLLAALSKPLFAIATTPSLVLGARFADRIGKGMRGAPRDALITDITPPEIRGAAFGLRQAMDTVGAFIGPLLGIALLWALSGDIRLLFWLAVIPAALAVLCVMFGVEERQAADKPAQLPIQFRDLKQLGRPFWRVVVLGIVFSLARFSEAFLILKAAEVGLPLMWAPAVLVVMNCVYALGAYPAGILADRLAPRTLLLWGLAALVAADIALASSSHLFGVFAGIALWGVYLALTQGLLSKIVADTAPALLRGSAFGIFNLATGLALLVASVLAGLVWDLYGSGTTFLVGATFAVVCGILLFSRSRKAG